MKTKETTMENAIKNVKAEFDEIIKAASDAKTTKYTCKGSGITHVEAPGEYNSRMTRAIAHDITSIALFLYSKDKDLADKIKDAGQQVRKMDIELRRMIDDYKDHRPVAVFPYECVFDIVKAFDALRHSEHEVDALISSYTETFPVWIDKIGKMTMWAYYIETRQVIREAIAEANNRCFDEDGNQVYGLNETDANTVKKLAKIATRLLDAYIKMPYMCEQADDCINKIEITSSVIEEIIKDNKL